MYKINKDEHNKIESITSLRRVDGENDPNKGMIFKESDLEEVLSKNLELIFGDDSASSMITIGRQVFDVNNKRSDILALADDGSTVVIELKRFRKDIQNRPEDFAMQAIRYAASLATIQSIDNLIETIYIPYLKKYENLNIEDTSEKYHQYAREQIDNLLGNKFDEDLFNNKQKIILVAYSFDDETLSSAAWLSENGIDIQCIEIQIFRDEEDYYILPNKILPSLKSEDFYVELRSGKTKTTNKNAISRRLLPKIDELIEWGVVKPNDTLYVKGGHGQATLNNDGTVTTENEKTMTLQQWLRECLNYSTVATYVYTLNEKGESLSELRERYMKENDIEEKFVNFYRST